MVRRLVIGSLLVVRVMVPDRFVRALDAFEKVLAATPSDRWLSPSPCEGWCAVDVAGHVTAGLLVVEARAVGRPLPEADPDWRELAGEDPLATWRRVRAEMMATLGPDALARRIQFATGRETTLSEWLEGYPLELVVHAWDLAQATGQSIVFDPDLVRSALQTAQWLAGWVREAGKVGPEGAVAEDADDQTRLLAVMGRSSLGN